MKKRYRPGFKLLDTFDKLEEIDPEMSPDRVLIVEFEVLKDIVTPARTELVKAIREHRPQSVGELAKLVKRRQESVSRDLNILHNYGLLEFVRMGKSRIPKIDKRIMVEV